MSHSNTPADNPGELESALRSLSPRKSAIDRDRLLFLAGQASADIETDFTLSRLKRWRWATCVASVAAMVMTAVLLGRPVPAPEIVERVRYVEAPRRLVERSQPSPERNPDEFVSEREASDWSDMGFVSSRTLRLRHPAMALNADDLPGTRYQDDVEAGDRASQSIQELRNSMLPRLRNRRASTPSSPSIGVGRFRFRLPLGGGE